MNNTVDLNDTFLMMFHLVRNMKIKNDINSGQKSFDFMESLTRRQTKALFVVGTHTKKFHDGMRLKDLASSLEMTIPATSVLVESMVRKNALVRSTSQEDRRAVCILLSPFGEELYTVLTKNMATMTQELLVGISEEEKAVFDKVIRHFYDKVMSK